MMVILKYIELCPKFGYQPVKILIFAREKNYFANIVNGLLVLALFRLSIGDTIFFSLVECLDSMAANYTLSA